MNSPGIDWSNSTMKANSSYGNDFMNFFIQNALVQQVSFPTRLNNVLDLIITNDPFIVHSVTDLPPFSTSDHCSIDFKIFAASNIDSSEPVFKNKFDYSNADWNGLGTALVNYDWSYMFSHYFKDELWDAFHSVICELITEFVPTKNCTYSQWWLFPISHPY